MLKKVLTGLLILLVVAFIGVQFVRPARTNPPVVESQTIFATGHVPPDVRAIIDRSCNDCHTNTVRWPWYSNVAPMSWLVVEDVDEGRKELNFSTWGKYKPRSQEHKLEEICEQVEKGEMPLKNYLYLHGDAKLSEADRQRLCEWTDQFRADVYGEGPDRRGKR
ncbi:MAG TPA: heme-binding domain-containing protein [Thermoanaerobaculia bacterium]|nr:heme-binding domain-containing protein [Thermoanaerobaculia bacterium]